MKLSNLLVVPALLALLTSCGAGFPNQLSVLWSVPMNGAGPSIVMGNQIVGSTAFEDNYRFTGVDLDTQKIVWRSETPKGPTFQQIMAGKGDYWYFHRTNSASLEVYRTNGTLVKQISYPGGSAGNQDGSNPVIYANTLYISNGDYLHSFDISTPDNPVLQWTYDAPSWLNDLVLDDEGYLYMGVQITENQDNLFKLDPKDQRVIWAARTYTTSVAEPNDPVGLILDGSRLITNVSNTMQAFDTTTGERVWLSKPLLICDEGSYAPGFNLELGEDSVFFISGSCVAAIQRATGKLQWVMDSLAATGANYTFSEKPTYYKGVVYAVNGNFWAIDAKSGEVLAVDTRLDRFSQSSYVHVYKDQLLVWGDNLTAYKPIR